MKKYDTAIIGAGPAGMMAAITASNDNKHVVLIDKNPQLGKKLLVTGNGRCNLTNKNLSIDRYHASDINFVKTVLNQFDQNATIDFFQNLGLVLKEEDNGRIFPRNNQASSVVEILRRKLIKNDVEIALSKEVVKIEKTNAWNISLSCGEIYHSDKLIIATGGRAAHHFGSTGDGLHWAQKLGHSLTMTHAALVPIETVEVWTKDIQGVKVEARVWATNADKIICESSGDLLFTSYGVSGPSVMALAGHIAPLLKTSKIVFHIDLFPEMTEDQLDLIIQRIIKNDKTQLLKEALIGLLPNAMIPVIIMLAEIDENVRVENISKDAHQNLIRCLKDLKLTVSKLRPYKEAQVTAGGVSFNEIEPKSMQSKLHDTLCFAGEIMDVYGDSGGFNLQWAWSSGYAAGKLISPNL